MSKKKKHKGQKVERFKKYEKKNDDVKKTEEINENTKKKHKIKKVEKSKVYEEFLTEKLAYYKNEIKNDRITGIINAVASAVFGAGSVYELTNLGKDAELGYKLAFIVLALAYLGGSIFFGLQSAKDFKNVKENKLNAEIAEVQLEAEKASNNE